MVLKILLGLLVLLAVWIASRIYRFLRATNAPLLQGELHCSVKYKTGKSLDVYLPTKKRYERAPVLVFFHGGGWVFGTKKMVNNARFNGVFNALREAGYAIVSPGYTLAKRGQSPFPACVEDGTDALAWIDANAEEYGFDLTNVGVMGESAGAHIGLLVSYSDRTAYAQGHNLNIKYIVDVYGPTNLAQLYTDLKPFLANLTTRTSNWPSLLRRRFDIVGNLFGFEPEAEPERARELLERFSPIRQLTAAAPPTLIIHGELDRLVPVGQSHELKERLEELEVPSQMYLLQGTGHSFRGAHPKQRELVQEWITDFVQRGYQKTYAETRSNERRARPSV